MNMRQRKKIVKNCHHCRFYRSTACTSVNICKIRRGACCAFKPLPKKKLVRKNIAGIPVHYFRKAG